MTATLAPVDEILAGFDLPDRAPSRYLPEDFWSARKVLGDIRTCAHSRQRSGDAVLVAVLAKVAAIIPHTIKMPPVVSSETPLCFFVVLLGPPGAGKSSAQRIAAELIPSDEFALGSGEGIVEVLFDFVKEPDDNGNMVNKKRQTAHNALVSIDEGDALAAIGSRSGSTLLSTLRTIWTGGQLGQTNASQDRRRNVPAGQYTYGLVMGLQEAKAGPLLADADAGTPQRFAWALATDPSIPDELPAFPCLGGLDWAPPSPGLLEAYKVTSGGFVRHYMTIAPSIQREIRSGDAEQARGFVNPDLFDAHAHLLTLKVAGLLALLEGRMDVTDEDWDLAVVMKETSDAVRRHAQDVVRKAAQTTETATSGRLARRQVEAASALDGWRTTECAKRIADKVAREPGRTAGAVKSALRHWRDVFDEGLDCALSNGWIVERPEPGQGQDKRALYPGDKKAA